MRSALAVLTAVLIALAAAAPHSHLGPQGSNGCQACVVRGAEEAGCATPDVAPLPVPAGDVPAPPGLPPVYGLPLGAIPGQSPPRA